MDGVFTNAFFGNAARRASAGFGLLALLLSLFPASPAYGATTDCTSTPDAAVDCFVANAVTSKLTEPRYGMTLTQFESYGVAVSKIMTSDQTYLVLFSLASAISDAMPATNANGVGDVAAQDLAVEQIIAAAAANGVVSAPAETTTQQMEYFALDLVSMMNGTSGMVELMAPGTTLRIVDSYVLSHMIAGQPNWTEVNASISTAVNNLITAGTLKLPANVSVNEVKGFLEATAKAIYSYKETTGRKSL